MRPILALDLNFFLLNFALSFIGIFEPLYILSLTGDFFWVAFYIFVLSLAVLVFTIPAGIFISRVGIGRGALVSGFARAAHLAFFVLAPAHPILFITLAGIFIGIAIPFYWISYHLINIYEVRKKAWGRQISYLLILGTLASLLGPAAGGLIIENLGFPILYAIAVILALLANLLLAIFRTKHKLPRVTLGGLSDGILGGGLLRMIAGYGGAGIMGIFWAYLFPLLAFEVVGKSYGTLGTLVSLSVLISLLPLWYFGRVTDKDGAMGPLLRFGATMQAFLWILRGLIRTPVDFLVVRSAGMFLSGAYAVPFDNLTYRLAGKKAPLAFLVKRELAIWVGGLVSAPLIWGLYLAPVSWVVRFIPAALASFCPLLLLRLLKEQKMGWRRILPFL